MNYKNLKVVLVGILLRLVSHQFETWSRAKICPVQPVFTERDQRFCSLFVTQTSWQGERCKIHLICCDSAKDDSLMMFLKCKSPERYISSPQFVSDNIKAFTSAQVCLHCELIQRQGEIERFSHKKIHSSATWKQGATLETVSSGAAKHRFNWLFLFWLK